MKRWSQGELNKCRKQVAILLDRGPGLDRPVERFPRSFGSISSCTQGGRDVVLCQDYRRLNAITQKSVEPFPHIDQLVD